MQNYMTTMQTVMSKNRMRGYESRTITDDKERLCDTCKHAYVALYTAVLQTRGRGPRSSA